MMKQIEGYQWHCTWTSHLGCLKASSDYLGLNHSLAWLFGCTGHAFIINFQEKACGSGPTAWRTERLLELGHNLGYAVTGVFGGKWEDDFTAKQKRAYAAVQYALAKGLPCYGWELDIPEFYCIHGCDETGYYYTGPTASKAKGPKNWAELGQTDIGILEVYYHERCEEATPRIQVKEALEFALEHASGPAKWIYPSYSSGLRGYDAWIQTLRRGDGDPFGLGYNAALWHECRHFAVQFLQEAKERLGLAPEAFAEALRCYEEVKRQLCLVKDICPFPAQEGNVPDKDKAVEALTLARSSEEAGLKALEQLVAILCENKDPIS